jgi:hypothetical protein
MTIEVDFLPFANGTDSPNVLSQLSYVAAQSTGLWGDVGFTAGIANSSYLNKVWRQSSVMSAALANAIANTLNENVLDSGGPSAVTALTAQILGLISAAASTSVPPITPQGRLTLASGTPVLSSTVTGSSAVYYTAYTGNYVPVWNGSQFINLVFASDLTLNLTSALNSNGIVDVWGFSNGGTLTLGFGPNWANYTPGSGSRGTGAGTTQLARTGGIWTNAVSITLYNGSTTYSGISAGQATYLGSVYGDSSAGHTSCYTSFGTLRKWGVWNAYHRVPIFLKGGDGAVSWAITGSSWQPQNSSANNTIYLFTGLPEESADVTAQMRIAPGNDGSTTQCGIGWNSTSAPSGTVGYHSQVQYGAGHPLVARYAAPAFGINAATLLEYSSGNTGYGTETYSGVFAEYRG